MNSGAAIQASTRTVARIVIASDHVMLRSGLRLALERAASTAVVDEVPVSPPDAAAVAAMSPDVVIVDLVPREAEALRLLHLLRRRAPAVRAVVLALRSEAALLRAALEAGAAGFVLKRSPVEVLQRAIASACDGRVFIDSAVEVDAEGPPSPALSAREREVLRLLARGFTYGEVGAQLHVGARTVETHRRNIATKLELHRRADLVRYALEVGLLAPGEVEPKAPR